MRHLKDEIWLTIVKYALIPVVIIAAIGVVMGLIYWNTHVLERNTEGRQLVADVIAGIAADYEQRADEVADAGYDLTVLRQNRQRQTDLYARLYKLVNITHDNTSFYLLDKDGQIILANHPKLPEYLQLPSNGKWGIFHRMMLRPKETLMEFGTNERFYERDMIIGRAMLKDNAIQGYIVFVIPGAYLRQSIFSPDVQFVIADTYDYTPIATESVFSDAGFQKLHSSLRNAAGSVSFRKQQYYVSQSSILDGRLRVYAFSPIGNMITQYATGVGILFGVLLIMIPIIIVSVRRETVRNMAAIDEIITSFAAVKNGNLERQIILPSGNEFGVIAEAYNRMVSSLHKLMELNKEKARAKVVSEVKQLESQFNPHFLFNTLENIKFMVKLDPDAAVRMIVALSALLRYSINNDVQRVSIRQDIDYMQNYIDIQKYRFGSRLIYEQELDKSAEQCCIPKLMMQPIIENAMKYGADSEGNIHIQTRIVRKGSLLAISIQDSGVGIEDTMLLRLRQMLADGKQETMHMGLYNIHRRIQLLYGKAYGVEINSQMGKGTCVSILLPADSADCYEEG